MLRGVWSHDEFAYEGQGFTASGVSANPKPAHVPIWIGGNSALTRRRVAAHGDGWNPFPAPAQLAQTSRTVPLEGLDDLAPMLDHLWRHVDEAGRDRATIDVAFTTGLPGPADDGVRRATPTSTRSTPWPRSASPGTASRSPATRSTRPIEAVERYGVIEVITTE